MREPYAPVLRRCHGGDFEAIYAIINDAAVRYRGVIPDDRWKEPYLARDELRHEIDARVAFWGAEDAGRLIGVMGTQAVADVTLIRHAYVATARQSQGIGSALLAKVCSETSGPILVGTWADAVWAIRFYEVHGFSRVSPAEKDRLLAEYWSIPRRQVETSVVLADREWFERRRR